jgi:hypothetical protein
MSNIYVCVVGISAEDDGQDAFHDLAGVSPHLFSDRKDGVAGKESGRIFDPETSI